jgi:hypothetical protein
MHNIREDDDEVVFLRRRDVRKDKFRDEKNAELRERHDAKQRKLQKKLRAREAE